MQKKDILEFYIASGISEIIGDEPFGVQKKEAPAPLQSAASVVVRNTVDTIQNSKEICDSAKTLAELKTLVENFTGCSLKTTAANTVFGDGNPSSKLMIIGEAPGADEDRQGLPFVGRSGRLLDKMLGTLGITRQNCYITNILPWRPPGNRTPTAVEVSVCLPFLQKQIELIRPEIILVLGGSAANSLLDNAEPISRLRGKWWEYQTKNHQKIEVLATFHPAYLLRNPAQKSKVWQDFIKLNKKLPSTQEAVN